MWLTIYKEFWIILAHLLLELPRSFSLWLISPENLDILDSSLLITRSEESNMRTGLHSTVRFGSTTIGSKSILCSGSLKYFLSIDTWKTLCTPFNDSGNYKRKAKLPTRAMITNRPIYHGLSFPVVPNLTTPLVGDTLRSTWSPTTNSRSRLLTSA